MRKAKYQQDIYPGSVIIASGLDVDIDIDKAGGVREVVCLFDVTDCFEPVNVLVHSPCRDYFFALDGFGDEFSARVESELSRWIRRYYDLVIKHAVDQGHDVTL